MYDIFYFGEKPNTLLPATKANSIAAARVLAKTTHFWYINGDNDYSNFDFNYVPAPWESTHTFVWPSQWQKDGETYLACTAEEGPSHYLDENIPRLTNVDVFVMDAFNKNSEQNIAAIKDLHPDATKVRQVGTTLNTILKCCRKSNSDYIWVLSSRYNYSEFDFNWHPAVWERALTHVFPSKSQQWGDTFFINKHELIRLAEFYDDITDYPNLNFVSDQSVTIDADHADVFVIDTFNKHNTKNLDIIKNTYSDAIKVRQVGTTLDTVLNCCRKSNSDYIWVLSSEYDYSDFNFNWHPPVWELKSTHVFPSAMQQWSNTFFINRAEFIRLSEFYNDITDYPNLNFVSDQTVTIDVDHAEIWMVEHQGYNTNLQCDHKTTRFFDSYLATLKRIVAKTDKDYIWIVSNNCDYTDFRFDWEPEPWQKDMLHVFPSNDQKFGDTFYVPVKQFKEQMDGLELLEWFDTVTFSTTSVPRIAAPRIIYDNDSLADAIKGHIFKSEYEVFVHRSLENTECDYTPSVWRKEDRAVHTLCTSGSIAYIPADIAQTPINEVYDYPYIIKHNTVVEPKMDVVFISNGETIAQQNWEQLQKLCPTAKHSQGVTGRVAAYNAAARMSSTDYFYAVFAKTFVFDSFEFDEWPDRLQLPKHYIFHSRNQLNGLEYGCMNVNLYNCELVHTTKPGLDFTLSQPHTVIPRTISMTTFNEDPWLTWRSAFREVLKLTKYAETDQSLDTAHRLHVWTSEATGRNAEWCLAGANDAKEYYKDVDGRAIKLQLSFDWAWLEVYFNKKYGSIEDPKINSA